MRNFIVSIITTVMNNRSSINNNMNYQRTFCLPFQ